MNISILEFERRDLPHVAHVIGHCGGCSCLQDLKINGEKDRNLSKQKRSVTQLVISLPFKVILSNTFSTSFHFLT